MHAGSRVRCDVRLRRRADRPVPFEFLIQGDFVRTTLAAFLAARGLSTVRCPCGTAIAGVGAS